MGKLKGYRFTREVKKGRKRKESSLKEKLRKGYGKDRDREVEGERRYKIMVRKVTKCVGCVVLTKKQQKEEEKRKKMGVTRHTST